MSVAYGKQWAYCYRTDDEITKDLCERALGLLSSGHNVVCAVPSRQMKKLLLDNLCDFAGYPTLSRKFEGAECTANGARFMCRIVSGPNGGHVFDGLDTRKWVLLDMRPFDNQERKTEIMNTATHEVKPLDSLIAQSIAQAGTGGRGFVLDLMHTLGEDTRQDLQDLKDAAARQNEALNQMAELNAKGEDISEDEQDALDELTELVVNGTESITRLLEVIDIDSGHKAIEVRQSLPPVDDRVPPAHYRQHLAYNFQSLAELALTMGSDQTGAIQGVALFVGRRSIVAELNGWQDEGDIETLRMPLDRSAVFTELQATEGKALRLDQKALVKWLLTNKRYLNDDLAWIDDVRNMASTTKIDTEAGIQRAENKQQVTINTKAGAGVLNIPDTLKFFVPVLELDDGDTDSARWAEINVMLDIILPAPADGRTGFAFELAAIGTASAERARMDGVIEQVEKTIAAVRVELAELDEWAEDQHTRVLVVCGEPGREQRTLGCDAFGE